METRILGKTDLALSVIGLGTWAIGGGDWRYGWGPQDDADSIAAIHEALDAGINWIDTAPAYGLGHAETIIARVLKERSDSPIIATKCGLIGDKNRAVFPRLTKASIREEIELSLKRLEVDRIDLYQIHWPNPARDIEEAMQTLLELKQEGKIRYIGVSNFNVAQLERAAAITTIDSLQPPYSLLNREIERAILPWCVEHHVGVVAYSPLQSGILTEKASRAWVESLDRKDWRVHHFKYLQEPELTRTLSIVEELRKVAHAMELSISELAVRWVLSVRGVTSAIVGARKQGQISQILRGAERMLTPQEYERIESIMSLVPELANT